MIKQVEKILFQCSGSQLWPHGGICGRTLRKFFCYLIQNLQEWSPSIIFLERHPGDSSMQAVLIIAFQSNAAYISSPFVIQPHMLLEWNGNIVESSHNVISNALRIIALVQYNNLFTQSFIKLITNVKFRNPHAQGTYGIK